MSRTPIGRNGNRLPYGSITRLWNVVYNRLLAIGSITTATGGRHGKSPVPAFLEQPIQQRTGLRIRWNTEATYENDGRQ